MFRKIFAQGIRRSFLPLLLLLSLEGCAFDSVYHPHWTVRLDAPAPGGVTISVGQPLYVRAHSNTNERPENMIAMVNDVAVANMAISLQEGDPPLWIGDATWTPVAPGEYHLSVRMTYQGGTFDSEKVRIQVFTTSPTPTLVPLSNLPQTPFLELTADTTSLNAGECTFLHWSVSGIQPQSIDLNNQSVPVQGDMQVCPCSTTMYDLIVLAGDKYVQSVTINVSGTCQVSTFTPLPPASIQFWVDATSLQAGSCTFLHWETNALKTYLDGREVPASSQQRVCPCSGETHTLEAAFVDGSKQQRAVMINVSGSCSIPAPTNPPPPPTEPPDSTPPMVPAPLSPGNTNESNPPTQYCPVTLRWYAVSDPSGVTYEVRLDNRNTAGNWSTISTWKTTATEYVVPNTNLFCDFTDYRWRVRAWDGAGNSSNWSIWYFYAIPIP